MAVSVHCGHILPSDIRTISRLATARQRDGRTNITSPVKLTRIKLEHGHYLKGFAKANGDLCFTYFKGAAEIYQLDYVPTAEGLILADTITKKDLAARAPVGLSKSESLPTVNEIKEILGLNGIKALIKGLDRG
jgi:hypothetical protein